MKEWDYKKLSIAVFGDYCLDEYLWVDAALNEPSLETGLVAYQCTKRETYPGAAGTIAKNLAHLGLGAVYAIGYVGDDGRGFDLCQGLDSLGIKRDFLTIAKGRVTPTYTKPWLRENGEVRELNRIDTKNWTPTPQELEDSAIAGIKSLITGGSLNALIILDQMTEEDCGIITGRVRKALADIARENPKLLVYGDSRCRTELFEGMMIKGNNHEIPPETCEALYKKNGRPVINTLGEKGVALYAGAAPIKVPGVRVEGQIDVSGAGDMFTANFVAALSAGADLKEAAQIGNVAAALCVKQLGTSGRVTVEDILAFSKTLPLVE